MERCIKCKQEKDEAGYIFTDFGSGDLEEFICISCANKIPLESKEVK